MAFALSAVLESQKRIEEAIQKPLMGVVEFLKNYKPEVSVTNPQELPDVQPIIDSVEKLLKEFSKQKTDFAKAVESLNKSIGSFPKIPSKIELSDPKDYTENFKELNETLGKIDIKPDPPIVNVEAPDLKPIKEAVEKSKTPLQLDLSTYHAQDLDEMEEGIQYVGFTNPDGYWYILKNNIGENTMRYKFGKKDYADAWRYASTFRYYLLEKAINAIKT